MKGHKCSVAIFFALFIFFFSALISEGQSLRYSNHRDLSPPSDATLRLGPFYSNIRFSQSAGFRYTRTAGAGTDWLFGNRRGYILEDGWEYPLVSKLSLANYLLISKNMDLDLSIAISYAHYPMKTQEDEFIIDLAEEGITATLSTDFEITRFLKGMVSETAIYRTDYIDTTGITDRYGGQRYKYFKNHIALDLDWLLAQNKNAWLSLNRTDNIPLEDAYDDQESYTWGEAIGYEQQLTMFLSLGISARSAQTYYKVKTRTDVITSGVGAYANMTLTENTRGSIGVGYSFGGAIGESVDKDTATATASALLETKLSERMSQSISANRDQRGGFSSDLEVYNQARYELSWKEDRVGWGVFAGYGEVIPKIGGSGAYSTLSYGGRLTYPLTSFADLYCRTEYITRTNKDLKEWVDDPEWRNNYDTWISSAGTGFNITTKLRFSLQAEHIERISRSRDLAYTRDVFSGVFTYTYDF